MNNSEEFIYRPPGVDVSGALDATVSVKFSQGIRFLDPLGTLLLGMTKRQRIIFRLKHPIVYSKRGFRRIYRRVKRFFFKERLYFLDRKWVDKEDVLYLYPDNKE